MSQRAWGAFSPPPLPGGLQTQGLGREVPADRLHHLHPHHPYPSHPAPLFQEPLFAARVIYDLLFFFMVIIIVLNLIFGVIIDTFADLRSEKQKKEEILKTTCFICGEWCSSFCWGLGWGALALSGRGAFSRVPVLTSLWASCSVLLGNIWSAAS